MNLYEISTDFCSIECNETTAIRFSTGIIPVFVSNIKNHYLSEINDVEITTDGRHYYSVVFLDKKMKQRYFNLVKKIASNHIDDEMARLQSQKTSIQNSQVK